MKFHYEGFASSGHKTSGIVEADSLPSALELLNQRGVRPYFAERSQTNATQPTPTSVLTLSSLGLAWRAKTIRQLATLLAAGITLDRAVQILAAQPTVKKERDTLQQLLKKITSGQSLSGALRMLPDVFERDEVGLIQAGEQTGSLNNVLEELALLLERRTLIRSKLLSALVYPAFIMALAPISLLIIATVLVPNLTPLFENSGAVMPFALRAMIWMSEEIQARGVIWLIVLALFILLAVRILRMSPIRSLMGKLPVVSAVARRREAARICRTLGSLLRSGAPLQSALAVIAETSPGSVDSELLQTVRESVSKGLKLAKALEVVPSLDKTALQMIAIGEETNKLDTMLIFVADSEEKALEDYIDRLMILLTPTLTVLMGLFVGGIVMSIMSAILSVNDLVIQ